METNHHAHPAGLAAPKLPRMVTAGPAPLGPGAAAGADLSPAHKDDAHRLAGAAGIWVHREENRSDCASPARDEQTAPKLLATLTARLALVGWALTRTNGADGVPVYLASRWNRARPLDDLAAVATFADQVGAPS